jgi:hypothetical protein
VTAEEPLAGINHWIFGIHSDGEPKERTRFAKELPENQQRE